MTTARTAPLPPVTEVITRMGHQLRERLAALAIQDPFMIGIQTGGVWVAQQLHQALQLPSLLGTLNINFYRDDFTRIGVHPMVTPTQLQERVVDRDIILVDDVLYTGRTVRAALNEIFDYGRPASVTLVTLVDRGGRELPIQADIVGLHIALSAGEQIKLNGPQPLTLEITHS
ncbi:MAG: bifunctional pyr operon transcriptional regulator/uracil phosphoribosyltransferase PyrR [Gammaproteobacteria bacterium]|nr:bifunctional pyr operon transcriptional regulator/uracil phosphoribosyltransferase PyrR [Gammaproteobacteria bacterium]